ncbi:unnamed protein product [Ranitomeya imitator]|uniref:J domain-containing protein n=1 Tax=Ranitomeya imitator TaxID=111125 RepID=A0ABN9LWG9_9NEOB|nr:unnamed protein product [Ranitomeya imitator]
MRAKCKRCNKEMQGLVARMRQHHEKCGDEGRPRLTKKGNAFYVQKEYIEACNYYTKAIDCSSKNASYYGNRAATLIMLGKFREALEDAQQAVRLDDSFVKGHQREGKCHLTLGNAMAATRCFRKVLELEPNNEQTRQELKNAAAVLEYERIGEADFEKRDFRKCQQILHDEGIDAVDWPAHSPDLNPVEPIWDIMSHPIHQRYIAPQTVQESTGALLQGRSFLPVHWQVVTTDASLLGWGAVFRHLTVQGRWSALESSLPINVLEIWAIFLSLRHWERILRGLPIWIQMDNATAVAAVNVTLALSTVADIKCSGRDLALDQGKVVFCMDRALDLAPACHRFKILKAECLALLGRYPDAQSVASDILRMDSTNADALYVRGLCLYYEDCIEKAVQFFVQALKMFPDHQKARLACRNAKALKAKKEEGNQAFKEGNYEMAYRLYSEALSIDPNNIKTNAKLYCNRGTVNAKLKKLDEAIDDCTNAIKLDETYIKAYLRRAQCYTDTEQYEEAVRDYEKVYQTENTKEHKQFLKNAQLELKKSKRKDYYKILGVDKSASEDEIKKAYRKRALMHHPDLYLHFFCFFFLFRQTQWCSDRSSEGGGEKFKEVGEAFTILSDPKKKARYDSGQDLEEDGMNMGDFDANNIFKAFFSSPGGFSFEDTLFRMVKPVIRLWSVGIPGYLPQATFRALSGS